RQPVADSANVLLATLPTGSGFGEEALISNGKRNATITMRENGSLMRLKKNDFLNLLINPLISYFAHSEMPAKLNEGCVVIDVRSEQESKEKPLEGAVNIPLSMLRLKLDSLNSDREYLLVCNDGSQSAAAAFLVIQHGLKCSVLEAGLNNAKPNSPARTETKPATTETSTQVVEAKKQAEKIAQQQQQIKAAREKAEQDIIRHKKELAESRARIAQKKTTAQQASQQSAADKLKAEEMMKQSAVIAEQTRKKAEQEAAVIKQQALEEAERLRAEKAAQELAKAEAERKAIEQRQKETNEAMRRAEEMMKQSAAAAEQAKKQAELEAELIKQRAMEEAEYLRAEVEAARQKMEQDAARLKEEEKIIKTSALKIKNEADEIRRSALNEAKQIRDEIESTRAVLEQKLQQTKDEEKRKHEAIIAEAKKQADKLAESKTKEAAAEAEAIRQKAKQDAERLHHELEQTRKQIEAEANRVINDLKEQSKKTAAAEQDVKVIHEETIVEVVSESERLLNTKPHEEMVDYKSVSIPGMSPVEPLSDIDAKRKAEVIKAKLAQSQPINIPAETTANTGSQVNISKNNDKTILESEDDLFIFKEPEIVANSPSVEAEKQPAISHRTQAESSLTQISTKPAQAEVKKSVVIYPKQEQESAYKNNPFLNQDESQAASVSPASAAAPQFDKQAYMRRKQDSKSNTFAIAASFILILAGAVFTLHATNTLKVQSIAALFNSGNDTVQPGTAIAKTKTIRKKVLRADTKVNIKKKVGNKMDDIMQNWQEVLSDAENPKKAKK
ncbi:MAG: rhodanese-like domain-containing protein, partial [Gammaproteobacteria bacterium]|nr:rhodanese-like domain-containing protein [Gammaproteobacteria bacterium]